MASGIGTHGGRHGHCQQKEKCTGAGCRAETGKTARKRKTRSAK